MSRLLATLGGVYELLRLGVICRFRLRGAYWSWRAETAWGENRPHGREMLVQILAYGRWVHRMRRHG